MDEVDRISIHTLRTIGCKLPDTIISLREFTADLVVHAASRCLRLINDELNLPDHLPASMSARFRVGTSLAEAFKGIGYQGEIGYQTFLYCNEHELRRIIMFVIEKLPKETSEAVDEPMGSSVLLNRKIANELKRQLACPWTPAYCKQRNAHMLQRDQLKSQGFASDNQTRTTDLSWPSQLKDKTKYDSDAKVYYGKYMKIISDQPPSSKDLVMSVIEMNTLRNVAAAEWENEWHHSGMSSRLSQEEYKEQKKARLMKKIQMQLLAAKQKVDSQSGKVTLDQLVDSLSGSATSKGSGSKGSRFTHAEKLQFAKDDEDVAKVIAETAATATTTSTEDMKVDTEEERKKRQEDELNDLQENLAILNQKINDILIETKQGKAQISQVVDEEISIANKNKEEEMTYRLKKKAIELLPDAADNIKKLEDVIENSSQRLVNLAGQWEKRRKPMVDEIRKLKDETETRESELEVMVGKIKQLRIKMKDVADDTREKEELHKQLVVEYEQMSKDVNRSSYTKRILEIVANIKRQKDDIQKVLLDTRNLQKAINFLSGKLDRTFTEADELLFKDAKKDDFSRKSYKLLASVHDNFGSLVQMVEETGSIMREIRDIEEQIDSSNQEECNENLQSITKDLKNIKEENNALMKQLKSMKN